MFKTILTLILLCTFVFITKANADSSAHLNWSMTKEDLRRGVKNDPTPPLKRRPTYELPPLTEIGAIRSVKIFDKRKVIALTFDLCELTNLASGCDMDLLGYLYREKIPATLFMGGKWMRSHAKRVKQFLLTNLFEIGNHAWTHGNCALLTKKGLQGQILYTQAQFELLRAELSQSLQRDGQPLPKIQAIPLLFRPPYARCTKENLAQIAQMGLKVVLWNIVAETKSINNQRAAKAQALMLIKQVQPGAIILFHANLVPVGTALLVQELVPLLQKEGYEFVTVSKLLELGEPERTLDGYFSKPGDNLRYDKGFGVDGTGSAQPFSGD